MEQRLIKNTIQRISILLEYLPQSLDDTTVEYINGVQQPSKMELMIKHKDYLKGFETLIEELCRPRPNIERNCDSDDKSINDQETESNIFDTDQSQDSRSSDSDNESINDQETPTESSNFDAEQTQDSKSILQQDDERSHKKRPRPKIDLNRDSGVKRLSDDDESSNPIAKQILRCPTLSLRLFDDDDLVESESPQSQAVDTTHKTTQKPITIRTTKTARNHKQNTSLQLPIV